MGLTIIRDGEHDWCEAPDTWPGKAGGGEPALSYKALLPRGPGRPNMQRTRYEPYHFEPPHSHPEDEILYLLGGELQLGDQTLFPGDALFIEKDTRYSLRASASGAEFLRVGFGEN